MLRKRTWLVIWLMGLPILLGTVAAIMASSPLLGAITAVYAAADLAYAPRVARKRRVSTRPDSPGSQRAELYRRAPTIFGVVGALAGISQLVFSGGEFASVAIGAALLGLSGWVLFGRQFK